VGTLYAAGLAHRISQCFEVVGTAGIIVEIGVRTDHFPTPGRRQVDRMPRAEIIGMRFGRGGQRPYDGGRIGIGIGQRGNGRVRTPGPRAPPRSGHLGTVTSQKPPPPDGAPCNSGPSAELLDWISHGGPQRELEPRSRRAGSSTRTSGHGDRAPESPDLVARPSRAGPARATAAGRTAGRPDARSAVRSRGTGSGGRPRGAVAE
jgi:hypothetical protein